MNEPKPIFLLIKNLCNSDQLNLFHFLEKRKLPDTICIFPSLSDGLFLTEAARIYELSQKLLPFLQEYQLHEKDLEKVFSTLIWIPIERAKKLQKMVIILLGTKTLETLFLQPNKQYGKLDIESDPSKTNNLGQISLDSLLASNSCLENIISELSVSKE